MTSAFGSNLDYALSVEGLRSGYTTLQVVRDAALRVAVGEVVLLTGHNGAGKSCLVETVFGLVKPTAGRVRWRGEDVTGRAPRGMLEAGVALVPQGGGVMRKMTVWENLQLVAPSLRRSRSRGPEADLVDAVLARVPILAERRDQIAGSLSGGQMRLLAIARALIARPRLLIIDEPFLGLSGASGDLVLDLIDYLIGAGERIGVLVVEQQLFRLTGRIDRYYVMSQGHIVRDGTGTELWALNPEELWSLH